MLRPLWVHGVGLLFVGPCIDARRVSDGKWRRGLGGATAAYVHLLDCWHIHGLLSRAARGQHRWAACKRRSPGPTVPSCKLHWTVEEGDVRKFWLFLWLFSVKHKVTEAVMCVAQLLLDVIIKSGKHTRKNTGAEGHWPENFQKSAKQAGPFLFQIQVSTTNPYLFDP